MKTRWIILAAAWLPLAAHADKFTLSGPVPPAFQAECASCHVAFPPQLLVADDWQRVMTALDKHYGDNASLDANVRQSIEEFLVRNAGNPKKVGAGGTATELPRLTQTAWFKRKHRKVAQADWAHAKIKTAANCTACHTQAAQGSYREREIVMPVGKKAGKKWEE
jgi:cytochrome c553